MPRIREAGTAKPYRAGGLVQPSGARRLLTLSVACGAAVLAGAVLLSVAGARQTMSPGDVSSHHARIDLRCGQCHGAGVQAVRCERCHDAAGTDRLRQAAHVLAGSGNRSLADAALDQACTNCHTEHRGRTFNIAAVDDRECASCHAFRALGAHPEFAPLRVAASTGGVIFDHDRHIREAEKARGMACQTCHEPSSDRRGFQPIAFDRHCASCHTRDGRLTGETDFVAPDFLVLPADVPAEWLGPSRPDIQANPRGRYKAAGLRHRDEWVLYNAARLRRGIDRAEDDAERLSLRARISYLEQLDAAPASRLVPAAERDAAVKDLDDELTALDRQLFASQSGATDGAALAEVTTTAQALLAALPSDDGTAMPAPQSMDGDFEARRRELLSLLDAVEQRLGDRARGSVSALRRRVLALQPGAAGTDDLARRQRQLRRMRDRLIAEQAIDAAPLDRDEAPSVDGGIDRAELGQTLTALRARLAAIERAPRMAAPSNEDERLARIAALESLLTPCRKCHELTASRSRLAPVTIAASVMARAVFTHAPHTMGARCESCHVNIRASKAARDVNLPGVATCQACHRPAQVTTQCGACHRYHPASPVRLAVTQP